MIKMTNLTPCAVNTLAVHYNYKDSKYIASTDEQRELCDELLKRYRYHDRLVEALRYLLDEHPRKGVYHDCTDNGLSECEYCEGRNLLTEMEQKQ